MYKLVVIGVDPSYKSTGISVAADGVLKSVQSERFDGCENRSRKRFLLKARLHAAVRKLEYEAENVIVVCERVRFNRQLLSFEQVKYASELQAAIVDAVAAHGTEVYSVPTVSWKAAVVGTAKAQENELGVDPAKWPTIQYIDRLGWLRKILVPASARQSKGVVTYDGERFVYDSDAADSACIALFPFTNGAKEKMQKEE